MLWRREPALILGLVQTVLALVLAFGLADLSTEQIGSVLAVTAALLAVVTRRNVYSPYTVANDPTLPALEGTMPGPTPQGEPGPNEAA